MISSPKAASLALLCCLALAGCAGAGPHVYSAPMERWARVGRVAVIPFTNATAAPQASRVATGAFIAGLVGTGRFRVEFQGMVRSFFIRERLVVRGGMDLKTLAMMRDRLGLDAVVVGRVEEYAGSEDIHRAVMPRATLSVRMVDTATGRILFMARQHRTGEDYATVLGMGRVLTTGALCRLLVDEIVQRMPLAARPQAAKEDRG